MLVVSGASQQHLIRRVSLFCGPVKSASQHPREVHGRTEDIFFRARHPRPPRTGTRRPRRRACRAALVPAAQSRQESWRRCLDQPGVWSRIDCASRKSAPSASRKTPREKSLYERSIVYSLVLQHLTFIASNPSHTAQLFPAFFSSKKTKQVLCKSGPNYDLHPICTSDLQGVCTIVPVSPSRGMCAGIPGTRAEPLITYEHPHMPGIWD